MTRQTLGLVFLMIFAVSQGARDAFFGHIFQSVSPWVAAVITFGISITVIGGWAARRNPSDLVNLFRPAGPLITLNVTTAIGWLGLFSGLTYLEPAAVATLYNGLGMFVILAIRMNGENSTAKQGRIRKLEGVMYGLLALTLCTMVFVVLTDRSGWASVERDLQVIALMAVLVGGAMIAISHLIARHITDSGVTSEAVTGGRYLLAIFIAGTWLSIGNAPTDWPSASGLAALAATIFALIILPSHILQLGVARTNPLTVNVIRALGPVFVFAAQQLDGRLTFSGATMACVVAYCLFAVVASGVRAGGEVQDNVSSSTNASSRTTRNQ